VAQANIVVPTSLPQELSKAHFMCPACQVSCSLIVELEGGRPSKIYGDKDNPVSHGYSCIRGRELANYSTLPSRLRSSMERLPDGRFRPISSEEATSKIAAKLKAIVAEHGPRSVAVYAGAFCLQNTLANTFTVAMMEAIGSPMYFTPEPIDQPGKPIAAALHGQWMGGFQRNIDGFDIAILFGSNPLVAHAGPFGNSPAYNLNRAKRAGMKLVVFDPRRSETAQKADLLFQLRPAEDAAVVAGLIHVILEEELYDKAFVASEADGLEALRAAVADYSPEYVAARADINGDDLVTVARMLAAAKRSMIHFGTGPNMSGRSTLCEYLGLCLRTLCGHWPRAGEHIRNPGVLINFAKAIAATRGPTPASGFGENLRVHNLSNSAAGMPTAALPDEMLTPGEGRVRAFLNIGGNPMVGFPDQEKTAAAMASLDLLVTVDPHMSGTARVSDYVLAPTVGLEAARSTGFWEQSIAYPTIYGWDVPYSQFSPALIDPPEGSDVLEEWQYIYKICQKMGLQLTLASASTTSIATSASDNELPDAGTIKPISTRIDMNHDMSTMEAWDVVYRGSPVPWNEVIRKSAAGHVFDVPEKRVAPKPPGWMGRFDIANTEMIAELVEMAEEDYVAKRNALPFRMLSRRLKDVFNSCWTEHDPLRRQWPYNPAFLNPADIQALKVDPGALVRITSEKASIIGVVEADPDVRPGCVSMAHGWGTNPDEPDDARSQGGTTSRLCDTDKPTDRHSWMPLMSAIPVAIAPVPEAADQ